MPITQYPAPVAAPAAAPSDVAAARDALLAAVAAGELHDSADLQTVLAALGNINIPVTDLGPVLAAVGNVLAAVNGINIPTTDVAAALAAYDVATVNQVAAGRVDVAQRVIDLTALVQDAVAKTTDLAPLSAKLDTAAADRAANVQTLTTNQAALVAGQADVKSWVTTCKQACIDALTTVVNAARDLILAGQDSINGAIGGLQLTTNYVRMNMAQVQDVNTARDAVSAQLTGVQANVNAHTDLKVGNLQGTLLASLGLRSGQRATFRADKVPADCTKIAATDFIPSGGILIASGASGVYSTYSAAVYVGTGPNPGVYVLSGNKLQRFDLATNAPVGNAFTLPLVGTTANTPGMAVQGSKIYIAGLLGSTNVASNLHLMFDTATGGTTQLPPFPATVGGLTTIMTRSVALDDGRIVTTACAVGGITQVGLTTGQFFIYDTAAQSTAPASYSVTLPLTKFWVNGNLQMAKIPANAGIPGQPLVLIDGAAPATGNLQSCVLGVVTGFGATGAPVVGSAEDTGATGLINWLLTTATGLIAGNSSTTSKAYTYNGTTTGWVTNPVGSWPWAYGGSPGSACAIASVVPSGGVFFYGLSAAVPVSVVYLTAVPTPAATYVDVMKT